MSARETRFIMPRRLAPDALSRLPGSTGSLVVHKLLEHRPFDTGPLVRGKIRFGISILPRGAGSLHRSKPKIFNPLPMDAAPQFRRGRTV